MPNSLAKEFERTFDFVSTNQRAKLLHHIKDTKLVGRNDDGDFIFKGSDGANYRVEKLMDKVQIIKSNHESDKFSNSSKGNLDETGKMNIQMKLRLHLQNHIVR